jgi:hypothetical protein
MKIYGRDGWPVETYEGRPVTNFIRYMLHGKIAETWRRYKSRG